MTDRVSHSLVKALQGVPAFASVEDRLLLHIVGASANLFWSSGALIFEEGTPGDALYIVLAGEVSVYTERDGAVVEAARIGPGGFFGELSLLHNTIHSKSASAVGDTELMVLPKESFQTLLASHPDVDAYFRTESERRVESLRREAATQAGAE